ncbi:hypothetical protein DTO164E3_6897 [Paecilomyces variotii]|nr:hypothetical protein DTO164E3_6897 [Paecilomyces variotii]KAJ9354104.1 hypothetical protein DTO280E4_6986 [Paecilomyces variotii]
MSSPTSLSDDHAVSLSSLAMIEKQAECPDDSHGGASCIPIVYKKLTFRTEVPIASPQIPDHLRPPDLKRLVSPHDWSPCRKAFITGISCSTTIFSGFGASSLGPAETQMAAEWHVSVVALAVGIMLYCFGFAIAPMVLAPFSEINGRRPVFIATSVLFLACQLGNSFTHSYVGMLLARFFGGIGGSAFSSMVGGIIADIYHAQNRNTPMVIFSGATLFGMGLGPIICGLIASNTTWRWIFWLQTIAAGIICVVLVLFLGETRENVVLRKKAKILNKWYEDLEKEGFYNFENDTYTPIRLRWKIAADEERTDLLTMLRISVIRPFQLLFTEPVVFFFSLWAAFCWGVLYLNIAVIPYVFEQMYHFSLVDSEATFTAVCVAAILGTFLSIFQENLALRRKGWNSVPEHRLYFSCIESTLLPIGLFMFGWTAEYHVHWIVPAIAAAISTLGIFSIYLAVFNYLADVYHRYASSALAAQSFCRNILGGVLPLVSIQMFRNLKYGPASSLLGGIGVLLTAVPWILVLYGPRIRAKSKLASEIML